ncbi:TolC family protein [Variovorax soli]|uniref:TolC family protein n=1 Tax=Variovorax soli TaxID=376815 RepID=UPI00083974A9|nr:TolC family protein [Variovorax soli]
MTHSPAIAPRARTLRIGLPLCQLTAGLFVVGMALGDAPAHAQTQAPAPTHPGAAPAAAPAGSAPSPSSTRSPSAFADWLESHSDSLGSGPMPSEFELRRILFDAVRTAAEHSPQVKQAYSNFQASLSEVDQAKGERWPQVDIGTQTKSLQYGSNANSAPLPGNQLGVTVTTSVFDFGRINKNIASREQSASAAQQAHEAQLEESAQEVVNTLVEIAKQRLVVQLSEQYLDRMQRLAAMLKEIVQVDRGRSSELTQATSRVLEAQAKRDSAQMKVRDAELNLRKLVGESHPVALPLTSTWPLQPAVLEHLLAQVEQHPSMLEAQASAKAADLQAATVKASSMPSVNWVVSANFGKDAYGRQQPWQTNLAANWPLFRGGSAQAAYKAALSRADASRDVIDQQRRDLTYGIRAAHQDATTLLSRADLYIQLSSETDRVRKAFFEQWHHLGKRTLLDVLSAESEHYNNRVTEVTTRFEGYQAVFREYSQAGILSRWLERGE